ncbi:MAG: transketolase [Proteobacteria bacterium]|nr:transketolase [Pseudomonadota bacterium]
MSSQELEKVARGIGAQIIRMQFAAGTPHLASALSTVEILVAAYCGVLRINPTDPRHPDRDRFIFSKGHAVPALYSILAHGGFFPNELLATFAAEGSALPEQPARCCAPGVELATGSLGHGLSVGLGHALAAKIQKKSYRVMVLVSDGECNEGSVWEAAMFVPTQQLSNMVLIVDFNKWQATGRSEQVMALSPLKDKFAAFGWRAYEVDGHDIGAIQKLLANTPDGFGKPVAIVAHTVKGKGVSFCEDDNHWHYATLKQEHVTRALQELGGA